VSSRGGGPRLARCLSVALLGVASYAWSAETGPSLPPPAPDRDWVFLQGGLGLVEVGHLEAGFFLTPKIDAEVWLTWAGVFGSRLGFGGTYVFGTSEAGRTPRRGFSLGARVMLDRSATFDSHGDDLSSYFAIPVGYALRRDSGLYWRFAVAAIVARNRASQSTPPPPGVTPPITHVWRPGGPFVTASVGLVF